MSSLVLDLQQELMQADCNILTSLRKAHIIATKLKLDDFDTWIKSELNGYTCSQDCIPEYREIHGQIKAWNPYRGWVPLILRNQKMEDSLCKNKMTESISDIIALCNKDSSGHIVMTFITEVANQLNSVTNVPFPTEYSLHISTHQLQSIIEYVTNCLLEWTLQLEAEGIIGENMSFKQEEKDSARNLPQQINNYYGSVINGDVGQAQVVTGDSNSINFNYSTAEEALNKVKQAINSAELSEEDKTTAIALTDDIETKIVGKQKPSIIKAALSGLKGFLSSVGAGVAVEIIAEILRTVF